MCTLTHSEKIFMKLDLIAWSDCLMSSNDIIFPSIDSKQARRNDPRCLLFFFFLSYKRFMLTEKDSSYCRMQHLSQSKQRKNQLPKNACFRANKGVSDHSIPHHLCTLNIHLAISIPSLCHFISKETYLCRSLGIPNCTCVKWLPSSPG